MCGNNFSSTALGAAFWIQDKESVRNLFFIFSSTASQELPYFRQCCSDERRQTVYCYRTKVPAGFFTVSLEVHVTVFTDHMPLKRTHE